VGAGSRGRARWRRTASRGRRGRPSCKVGAGEVASLNAGIRSNLERRLRAPAKSESLRRPGRRGLPVAARISARPESPADSRTSDRAHPPPCAAERPARHPARSSAASSPLRRATSRKAPGWIGVGGQRRSGEGLEREVVVVASGSFTRRRAVGGSPAPSELQHAAVGRQKLEFHLGRSRRAARPAAGSPSSVSVRPRSARPARSSSGRTELSISAITRAHERAARCPSLGSGAARGGVVAGPAGARRRRRLRVARVLRVGSRAGNSGDCLESNSWLTG